MCFGGGGSWEERAGLLLDRAGRLQPPRRDRVAGGAGASASSPRSRALVVHDCYRPDALGAAAAPSRPTGSEAARRSATTSARQLRARTRGREACDAAAAAETASKPASTTCLLGDVLRATAVQAVWTQAPQDLRGAALSGGEEDRGRPPQIPGALRASAL